MDIKLDEKTHSYLVDGVGKVSVTQVLNFYFPPCEFFTENDRVKGSARHAWYGALVRGVEIENAPDLEIVPFIVGFKKFLLEVKPIYISGEVPFYDPILGVCGKPDLICSINDRLAVIDFKPKTKYKKTALQTGAYSLMLKANGINIRDRYELRLMENDYRLEKHTDSMDEKRWSVMVQAFKAMKFYK